MRGREVSPYLSCALVDESGQQVNVTSHLIASQSQPCRQIAREFLTSLHKVLHRSNVFIMVSEVKLRKINIELIFKSVLYKPEHVDR